MNNNPISLTEGLLIIEMPGRGVSLIRSGKSRSKRGRQGKTSFSGEDTRPTVMRDCHGFTKDIESRETKSHQIIKISEKLVEAWSIDPADDEYVWTASGKKFKPKYTRQQRFAIALQKHFECICIAANIVPSRCSWTYKS